MGAGGQRSAASALTSNVFHSCTAALPWRQSSLDPSRLPQSEDDLRRINIARRIYSGASAERGVPQGALVASVGGQRLQADTVLDGYVAGAVVGAAGEYYFRSLSIPAHI